MSNKKFLRLPNFTIKILDCTIRNCLTNNAKNNSFNQENSDQDILINPPKIERVKLVDFENYNRQSIEGRPTFYSPASSHWKMKINSSPALAAEK